MLCCECKESLLDVSKRVYYCDTCSPNKPDNTQYWCKNCEKTTDHKHKLSKVKGSHLNDVMGSEGTEKDKKSSKYLDSLFEEYHKLDCEDTIAGGTVKTRFRYTNVPK